MTRQYLLFPCVALFTSLLSFSQEKTALIRIVQDDTVHTPGPGQNHFVLERKSFKVQVLLQNLKGVYIHAGLKDSLYRLSDEAAVPGFQQLPELTMAEEEHNKEKELMVNDDGWSYWFYDPEMTWHRFNKKIIFLDSGRVVGSRSVKQLYFLPRRKVVKVKDNHLPLYLFFTAAEEDSQGRPVKELLRIKVKIDWREED